MFNWLILLSIASPILAVYSTVPYIRDIFRGSVRPNAVTWSLWVFILVIGLFAQLSTGWSLSLIFIGADLAATSVVAILSFSKYGYWNYGIIEWICLVFCIIAVIFWQLTSQPLIAIFFAILADLLAAIPTIVKAYKDPKSEYSPGWFILCLSALLAILSNGKITLDNSLFSAYLLAINGTIGILAFSGRNNK